MLSGPSRVEKHALKLPPASEPLTERHKRYLTRRGFDAELLEKKYGLLGTGPSSTLDGIDYKHRIVIPIMWEGELVSFQTRDITNKSKLKYVACPGFRERVDHKTILYGDGKWDRDKPVIVVEGVTDAWKLPWQTVAVFGIQFKLEQCRVLANLFREVIVVFDEDPQAIVQSKKLTAKLDMMGVRVRSEFIKGDPGDMEHDEALYFVRNRLGLTC